MLDAGQDATVQELSTSRGSSHKNVVDRLLGLRLPRKVQVTITAELPEVGPAETYTGRFVLPRNSVESAEDAYARSISGVD